MCDMIRPSFIPTSDIRQLRDLVRYREKLTYCLVGENNRAQNCLTVFNLKLYDVFSDVFGKSARSITEYILAHPGEYFDVSPFVDGRCKHPIEEIQAAVDGALSREQATKLRECLNHIDELKRHREKIETEIYRLAEPYACQLELLPTMFRECSADTIDFSNVVLKSICCVYRMFYNCKSKLLGLDKMDVSALENMRGMFDSYLGDELNVSGFDTKNVKDMSYMFAHCSKAKAIDVSHFDTSNVTDMAHMFAECENLEFVDLSNFNTSKVETMVDMFTGCKNLKTLDLSSFDTKSVKYMDSAFKNARISELIIGTFDLRQYRTILSAQMRRHFFVRRYKNPQAGYRPCQGFL